MTNKTILVITDGIGHNDSTNFNALKNANTPTYDYLFKNQPYSLIHTYGTHVGLPDGQIVSGVVVASGLYYYGHTTELFTPFYKLPIFDMGVFAIAFWMIVMVSTSNAVNLTDGLDGLATVPSIMSFFTLSAIVYVSGHAIFSSYLLIPNIKLAGELTILGSSLIGALIAFLWYNSHPAEVFMGDSGSLPLGGVMAYMAIVGKSEILLLIIGLIFVIETVSVILQVGSYKIRQKRVFLMAPIHHHFEHRGWKENKIIVRFWIISFMANLFALLSFKLR